jgi:hypothetical protein
MSRATPSARVRTVALLAVTFLAVVGVMALGASPAYAAKPCWERVLDDWLDNGRIDGVYSARCIEDARKHLPEDVRAYSDIEEKLDAELQENGRSAQGRGGSGGGGGPGAGGRRVIGEPEPDAGPRDEGPIQSVLGKGTTDASSIPLPLIILAALALILVAAGASGLVARKLKARRAGHG